MISNQSNLVAPQAELWDFSISCSHPEWNCFQIRELRQRQIYIRKKKQPRKLGNEQKTKSPNWKLQLTRGSMHKDIDISPNKLMKLTLKIL